MTSSPAALKLPGKGCLLVSTILLFNALTFAFSFSKSLVLAWRFRHCRADLGPFAPQAGEESAAILRFALSGRPTCPAPKSAPTAQLTAFRAASAGAAIGHRGIRLAVSAQCQHGAN